MAGYLRRRPPGRRTADQFAAAAEIAIVKNTSEGISFIATGLKWQAGAKIVAFREEFPANFFPWRKLEETGVRVEWLSVFDPLEKIEEAVRGAQLLSISFVQYLSGYRAPIEAIGEICRRSNCIFVVDAIQGLGAFPLDVRKCNIDALAADGHKWLLGPEGCGILYVSEKFRIGSSPWNSAGRMSPNTTIMRRATWRCGRMQAATNAEL